MREEYCLQGLPNFKEMKRFVIHIEGSPRRDKMLFELNKFYEGEFEIFNAIVKPKASQGISDSFKEIVRRNYEEPFIHILEDDVMFTSVNSRKIFDRSFTELPDNWQIYLGGSYTYKEVYDLGNIIQVNDYRSFHSVVINKNSYDYFLSHDTKLVDNIDTWVSRHTEKAYLCNPQVAIQYNGFSYNRGKEVNYSHFLKDKNILY